MSLDQVVGAILDDRGASPYLRAIRLFELQTALFYPSDFQKLIAATDHTRGASRRLRTARIYAGIKCLEHIEDELRGTASTSTVSIRELAQNNNYQEIFDSIIATNGGWSRIRHAVSAQLLDKRISEQRALARAVAKIIDFSYRFAEMPNRGSYIGGVNTARYVVINAKSYKLNIKKSTIKTRWRTFSPTAVFLYLLLVQKFSLMPPKLTSKRFLERLMGQAEDVVGLRSFFKAYQHVCDVLVSRNYKFEKLTLNINSEIPPLPTPSLQSDVILSFKESIGAKE